MSALACFVSPHGFGHAARTSAVIERMAARQSQLRFDLYTTVPRWFFADALGDRFTYHELACDLGLVQRSALEEDVPATVAALDAMLPFADRLLDDLAEQLRRSGCSAVLCDISPLGIAVARRAMLPVVLIENFTWGWIYRNHRQSTAELRRHAERLDEVTAQADLRLQAEPSCDCAPGAQQIGPIARRLREPRESVRRRLGIRRGEHVVLVSMGGVRWRYGDLQALQHVEGVAFVVPGAAETIRRDGALVRIPFRGPVLHPDLVNASDLVMGKLGYSTVAEAVHYGKRFLYVRRPSFPESPILESYVRRHLPSEVLEQCAFDAGDWARAATDLLERPVELQRAAVEDGAEAAAEVMLRDVLPTTR